MAAACGGPSAEHQTLTRFFEASRLRDTTLLARWSAVVFEPRVDGVVRSFEIVDEGDEVADADGSLLKQVTIDAQVRTPDGRDVQQPIVVTLRQMPGERAWFVLAFTPLPASRTSP